MTYQLTGFEGKTAVVTGAGRMRSIGRSIAVELARAGCDIVLTGTGRPPDRYPQHEAEAGWRDIASVADEVEALGRRALPLVSDISDDRAVRELADRALDTFGCVDILVNNAGAARGEDRRSVVDLEVNEWRAVLDINLTGTFLMSKVFGAHMIERRSGSIVNISSIAGKKFSANTSAYSASKAGIQALTACMAREVGGHNVRVNAVCPGITDTSRLDDVGRGSEWQQIVESMIPLGRAGSGLDIARAVLYLCSVEGSWITGQAWNVDGGTVVEH